MRGILEELEKAHIYVAQLNESLQEQTERNKAQQKMITALMEKFEQLEKQKR
ncbi:MAG: hypothetical protein JRF71_13465 [Deltaproteobacteria bacterium]|jgi:hypothetical protein|nr:hypothetical protein [Deltaproteobacteria bacterium]